MTFWKNRPRQRTVLLFAAALSLLAALSAAAWIEFAHDRQPPAKPLPAAQPQALLPDTSRLQAGDWIFRSGVSVDSRFIKRISHSPYSHIGMVVQTDPHIVVAHATTDDDPNLPNQVLLTPLADFAAADKADAVAVARPRFLNASQRRQSADYAARLQGKPFVLDERNHQPFYCTHVVLDAVRRHAPQFNPKWQYLDIAVFRGEYLFPEAFTHEDIAWIYR